MDELETVNNFLRARTGENSDVIMGMGYDPTLGQKLGITLIATGFEHKDPFQKQVPKKAEAPVEEKIVMTLVSEEANNDTSSLMTAPTELVAETPTEEPKTEEPKTEEPKTEEPKTEEPTIGDSYFTLEEEVVEAIEEVAAIMKEEVEEVMSIHELDVQTSFAANEVMEEMVSQPIIFEINDVSAEEDIEEVIVNKVLVNKVDEVLVNKVEELMVSELAAPVTEKNLTNHFIITKPSNIYAEHNQKEALLEEMEEMPIIEKTEVFEEMEKEMEKEVEKMEKMEKMEVILKQDDLAEIIKQTDSEAEPTMQLVMKEQSSFNTSQNNVKQHPSSFDMPVDDAEEQRRKVAERIQKLRNLSFNINNASDPNNEFDAVPAYVRRNLDLFGNTMASVENYYSKYTVEKDENNQTQISTINTFLDGKKPD
jgi:cell division protein FtsZ